MTAEQPPLWRDGWDVEPCDTADTSPDSSVNPRLIALLNATTCDGEGRAAGGPRLWVYLDKPIHDVAAPKEYL